MSLKATEDQLAASVAELTATVVELKAEREGDDSAERKAEVDAKLTKIDEQLAIIEQWQKDAAKFRLPGVEMADPKNPKKEGFGWGRAAKLLTSDFLYKGGVVPQELDKECGYEAKVFLETTEKAMEGWLARSSEIKAAINATGGSEGAFLIPEEVMADLIPELDAVMISSQLGVRRLDNLQGVVRWTRSEGGITAEYINTEEEREGAESKPTFSSVTMRPHVLAAFVPLTWEMTTQPSMALDAWVRGEIAREIGLKEDLSVFLGSGGDSNPLGIANTPGILTYDWSGLAAGGPAFGRGTALQNISQGLRGMALQMKNANSYAGARKLGWALNPNGMDAIANTVEKNTGKEVFIGPNDPNIARLQRYPVGETTQLPSTPADEFILFGDYNMALNGHWGTMAFASSDQTDGNFRKLRNTIRGVIAHDVGVLRREAFVNGLNFDTTSTA